LLVAPRDATSVFEGAAVLKDELGCVLGRAKEK
jgi:hypothetical protein